MKRIMLVGALVAALTGCAGTVVKDQATGAVTVDLTAGKLAIATHNDLLAAAAYAEKNGYAARAAVWRAHDAHLAAVEQQISACANAIAGDLAAMKPAVGGQVTPFLAAEMAAEAVGNFTGASAKTKILCAPFPLISLPGLPRLP